MNTLLASAMSFGFGLWSAPPLVPTPPPAGARESAQAAEPTDPPGLAQPTRMVVNEFVVPAGTTYIITDDRIIESLGDIRIEGTLLGDDARLGSPASDGRSVRLVARGTIFINGSLRVEGTDVCHVVFLRSIR